MNCKKNFFEMFLDHSLLLFQKLPAGVERVAGLITHLPPQCSGEFLGLCSRNDEKGPGKRYYMSFFAAVWGSLGVSLACLIPLLRLTLANPVAGVGAGNMKNEAKNKLESSPRSPSLSTGSGGWPRPPDSRGSNSSEFYVDQPHAAWGIAALASAEPQWDLSARTFFLFPG